MDNNIQIDNQMDDNKNIIRIKMKNINEQKEIGNDYKDDNIAEDYD